MSRAAAIEQSSNRQSRNRRIEQCEGARRYLKLKYGATKRTCNQLETVERQRWTRYFNRDRIEGSQLRNPGQLNQVKRPSTHSQFSSVCSFQDLPLTFFPLNKKAAKFSCVWVCASASVSASVVCCRGLTLSTAAATAQNIHSVSPHTPHPPHTLIPLQEQTQRRRRVVKEKFLERNLNWKSKMKRKALE